MHHLLNNNKNTLVSWYNVQQHISRRLVVGRLVGWLVGTTLSKLPTCKPSVICPAVCIVDAVKLATSAL